MMERQTTRKLLPLLAGTLCLVVSLNVAHAESLFHAGIGYQTSQPYTPRSLYSMPRPKTVGDTLTINITENTTVNIQNNSTISRKQDLTENNSGVINRVIKRLTGVRDFFPSVDGTENQHKLDLQARSQKQYQFNDLIACQVVQVLPNGFMVVQGRKSVNANQENQDLLISGIVNPYFVDSTNTVKSTQVANLQLQVIGKGMLTRQQGDGVIGKYWQILN